MAKQTLFLFRHAPYGTAVAREGLEAALAAGAYDQPVAILFLNDGVLQLVKHQEPEAGLKNHGRLLSALPLYGIDKLYVRDVDLRDRGLCQDDLLAPATLLTTEQVRALLASYDHLLSF